MEHSANVRNIDNTVLTFINKMAVSHTDVSMSIQGVYNIHAIKYTTSSCHLWWCTMWIINRQLSVYLDEYKMDYCFASPINPHSKYQWCTNQEQHQPLSIMLVEVSIWLQYGIFAQEMDQTISPIHNILAWPKNVISWPELSYQILHVLLSSSCTQ